MAEHRGAESEGLSFDSFGKFRCFFFLPRHHVSYSCIGMLVFTALYCFWSCSFVSICGLRNRKDLVVRVSSSTCIITSLKKFRPVRAWIFFRPYFLYYLSCVHNFEDRFHGVLAQFVERCTGIAEVMGTNPVRAWIFLTPYFHYYLRSVHNCEDRFHIRFFNRSWHIWFLYIYSHLFTTSRVYLYLT